MPRLIVYPGEANEREHDLEAGSSRIGRALEAEVSIADASLEEPLRLYRLDWARA